jgi:hypothetical protein
MSTCGVDSTRPPCTARLGRLGGTILAEVVLSETVIVVGVGLDVTLSPDEAGDEVSSTILKYREPA